MKKAPVFLHSLFRTGSTYIWNKFRQDHRFHCYYEPFHQVLALVDQENLSTALTTDFHSVHHPELNQSYFAEYEPLLKKNKKGIPYFQKEFSFDEFCRIDNNPQLKQYIDSLVAGAGEDKTPVLQFNRSAFRTQWFKQTYPDAVNIYLLRNPRDQWQSYVQLQERTKYDAFFTMDLLCAGVNARESLLEPLTRTIPILEYHSGDYIQEAAFYSQLQEFYSMEERYYIFYYIWFLAYMKNVMAADLLINVNRLTREPEYRIQVTRLLADNGVGDVDFSDARMNSYNSYALPLEQMLKIEQHVHKKIMEITPQVFAGKSVNDFLSRISPVDAGDCGLDLDRLKNFQYSHEATTTAPDSIPDKAPDTTPAFLRKGDINTLAIEKYRQIIVHQVERTNHLENQIKRNNHETDQLRRQLKKWETDSRSACRDSIRKRLSAPYKRLRRKISSFFKQPG